MAGSQIPGSTPGWVYADDSQWLQGLDPDMDLDLEPEPEPEPDPSQRCGWPVLMGWPLVSCSTAPAGVMALNKSLNISAVASPALAFYQILSAMCEEVEMGPALQNCRDHSQPETLQPLSIGLAWQASKGHPKQPSATQPAEFPCLLSCVRHIQSFLSVWTLNIFCAKPIC